MYGDKGYAGEHRSIFSGSRKASSGLSKTVGYLVNGYLGAYKPLPSAKSKALVSYHPGSSYKTLLNIMLALFYLPSYS